MIAVQLEPLSEDFRAALCVAENQNARRIFLSENSQKQRQFFVARNVNQFLVDFVHRDVLGFDRDFLRIARIFPSEIFHVSIESRGKKHGLATFGIRNEFKNLAQVGIKSHVKHSVGFVDHEERHRAQVELPAFFEIDDSPRSSDDEINALLQRLDLL